MESPTQVCENIDQRKRLHDFYLRNGFRDTNVYRTYNDITWTIMMMGKGTFTMQDWDDITNELNISGGLMTLTKSSSFNLCKQKPLPFWQRLLHFLQLLQLLHLQFLCLRVCCG